MTELIQAIRGMNDVLPAQTFAWQTLERSLIRCLTQYGYEEIRFPLVESTQLFKRSIGELTDIIEKEMYTFTDLNGDSLTLRPEGTAGCVRACLEHGLLHNQQQKLWYMGPMYRHEKPQKGRYRQFTQFGIEVFGIEGVAVEIELILICNRIWRELGIENSVQLQINTLGELTERQHYKEKLVAFLRTHSECLDEDSLRRLDRNPLRILDSKNGKIQELLKRAPKLIDFLGDASQQKFHALCEGLDQLNIDYVINPHLVRGLDYYGHTVFEWVTDKLGAQATLCGGGRYDALVPLLGGNATPAVGLAMGAERLLLLLQILNQNPVKTSAVTFFIIASNDAALYKGLALSDKLRDMYRDCRVITNVAGGSFKSQFKKADKSGAEFALIIGEDELLNNKIGLKNLRKSEEQLSIAEADLLTYLHQNIYTHSGLGCGLCGRE